VDLPDFSGKVVVFYLTNHVTERAGTPVLEPRFVTEGDRLFVRGAIPPGATQNDWASGATTAISWEHVVEYLVFESLEHYERGLASLQSATPLQ
jgi:hypothetical protein